MTEQNLLKYEARLVRTETIVNNLNNDIQEIKKLLRWVIIILISSHTTSMGLLAKGFNII